MSSEIERERERVACESERERERGPALPERIKILRVNGKIIRNHFRNAINEAAS